jgi:hypothetical protein
MLGGSIRSAGGAHGANHRAPVAHPQSHA